MARFLTELHVSLNDGSDTEWTLDKDLVYDSDLVLNVVVVPSGFETDFASVPRLPFAYLLVGGIGNRAAVVHDYLYSTGLYSKEIADNIFLEALTLCGIGWKRYPMYWAVRVFGGPHYCPTKEVLE
jgi:hypothetical protein